MTREQEEKKTTKKKTRSMNPIESHTNAPFLRFYFDFGPESNYLLIKQCNQPNYQAHPRVSCII